MNSVLIAMMLGAGAAAFVYAKVGRRAGYGNAKNVWTLVIVSFIVAFLVILILLKTLVDLG